jgi:hypothetical protein
MKKLVTVLIFVFLNINASEELKAQDKTGTVKGRVISGMTRNPIRGVTVRIEGTKLGGFTKSDGSFEIKNIPVGIYPIKFTAVGYEMYVESDVSITQARPVELDVRLAEKIVKLKGAEIKGSYFKRRITTVTSTQTLNANDIRRAPGVQEDVVRATALLPGVGVTGAGRNDLLVRGGAPFENLFVVDNIEVPNINHFGTQGSSGGPLSIINIDFVKNVDFSAGGFCSRYGDKVSSLTNITLRKGRTDRLGGSANLSATGFGIIGEGPVGHDGSFLFSVRRSYLDLVFKAAGFGFIPEYWVFHGKFDYTIDSKNSLSVLAIGALGTVTLNNDDADNRYENSRVVVPNQDQYFTGITWQTLLGNGFAKFTLGRNYTAFSTFQNDSSSPPQKIFYNNSKEGETILKADVDMQVSDNMEIAFGNQTKLASLLEYDVLIPAYLREDENGNPRGLDTDTNFTAFKNGTYFVFTGGMSPLRLTLSGRMDYYNYLDKKFFFSPRVCTKYGINTVSSLLLSAGRFYQSPSYVWMVGGYNSHLRPIRADQIVLGYEHTPLEDVKVQLETYYKWYSDYPARLYRPQAVLAPSGFGDVSSDIPFGLEPLTSAATGYSRGIELFIQKKLSEIPLYGLMSLTLSETRFNSLDGEERYGDYDSRIIFNLAAGYRFSDEWELSAKFRLATGRPTTDYLRSATPPYDYLPGGKLDFREYNEGDRLPTFHALDVRLDKRWYFEHFNLETYIDIQNIYGRENISAIRFNYRTGKPEYSKSIGVLPSIGVNFEF